MSPSKTPSTRCRPVLAVLFLAGCASPEVEVTSAHQGLKCVDDSPACISHRQATLKSLVGDPSRAWVSQKPDAAAYASGVRLFAFKTKKKELSCAELQAGRAEADAAPVALRAPGNGLTPSQISRSVMLASEIGRELLREHARRCKKA